MLLHPEVIRTKNSATPTVASIGGATEDITIATDLNFSTGESADLFDRILSHNNQDAARKRSLEKKKAAEAATAAINRTTKLTSGQLFRRDQICLTNPQILQEQLSYVAYKEDKRKEAKLRRRQERQRQLNKVNQIRQKDMSKWMIGDLKRMLTYKKQSGDAATTNIKDRDALVALWEARKNRISPTVSPEASDEEYEDRKLSVNELATAAGLPSLQAAGTVNPGDVFQYMGAMDTGFEDGHI